MPLDTATLALSGEIPFDRFAEAVKRFYDLLSGLSAEIAPSVVWMVDELSAGSALAVTRGVGPADQVEAVVRRYGEVGGQLEEGRKLSVTRSMKARRAAYGLRRIPGGRIESLRLETAEREAILRPVEQRAAGQKALRIAPRPLEGAAIRQATASFGAIEGRVQTLSSRGGLRFTLYDIINDKAVSCYLDEGYEDIMRNAWGRLAVVEGWISRDPMTGRSLAVRRVRSVQVLPERSPGAYRDARGVSPSLSGMLAEQAIRRLRDG
jgi:hypothetical protein